MRRQFIIAQILLWAFVIALGIECGAGLYETLVITPLWGGAAPDSVIAFYYHNTVNPYLTLDAGGRFWIFATPLVGLLSAATLLTSRWTDAAHRKWRVAGAGLAFFVIAFTFAWFVPNILLLQSKEVLTMNPEAVASLTNWWVGLNWARVVLGLTAWLCALRALSIPPEKCSY